MKEQPLFIEFYNLHLTSGYALLRRDETLRPENATYPDEEERKRLTEFLGTHSRVNTTYRKLEDITCLIKELVSYKEYWMKVRKRDRFREWIEARDQEIRTRFGVWVRSLAFTVEIRNSLAYYELNKLVESVEEELGNAEAPEIKEQIWNWLSGNSREIPEYVWERRHNFSWFTSKNFLEFSREYSIVRGVIDGYIKGGIPLGCYSSFDEIIRSYTVSLQFGMRGDTLSEEGKLDDTIMRLEDYNIAVGFYATHHMRYGLNLGRTMAEIHQGVAEMLVKRLPIRRCAYGGGTDKNRKPPCRNIFIVGKRRRYCSDKCGTKQRRYEYYLTHEGR